MSSAESSSYYFDINIVDKKSSGSPRMDWNLIFVTSWDKCSERNWKALEFYYYIAYQSIKQYKYDHALTWADCVSTDDMALAIQKSQDESDLPIIILDYSLSSKQRHTSNSLGHFAYAYNVKSIIMQAETLQIENKNTAWTLSHEIAHSSLNWLDYSREIHRDAPHNVQAEYNYCKGTDVTLTFCTPIWDSVITPSGSNHPIMKASYVLGIADSMKSKLASSNTSNQKTTIPKDPSNFNKLLSDYEWVKEQMKYRISWRLSEYSTQHFENPLAKEKLEYVIQQLSKMNFDNSDRYVENFKEDWNNGYYSDAEDLLRGEIDYWTNQQVAAIAALDWEYDKAVKLQKESKPVSIYVSINKETYQEGDPIEITIKVNNHQKYLDTFLIVIDPNNVAYRNKIQLNDRGEYNISSIVSPPNNELIGRYSLIVEHGSLTQTTHYSYTGQSETTQPSPIIQQDVRGKLELSNLQFKQFGKATTNFALGKEVKVTYLVKNSQNREHDFDLLFQVINESGKVEKQGWNPGSINSNQEFPVSRSWYPVESGKQQIKVSLLDKDDHTIQLTPPLKMSVTVQGNEPQPKIASNPEPKERKFCFLFWCWNF